MNIIKHKFLFLVGLTLFVFANTAKGQKNFPLPSDNPFWTEAHGSLWSCDYYGTNGWCYGYYCNCYMPVYYKSDTIINGNKYNRLYTRGICNADFTTQPDEGCPMFFSYQTSETLLATIRQDTLNKIVYIRDNNKDTLLYDFKNILVGQDYPKTYNNPSLYNDTVVVITEDSIILNYTYYKKWDLGIKSNGSISQQGFASIIEGIGSTYGILSTLHPPFENGDQLLCFSMNNIVIYPDSTYNCDKTLEVSENTKKQNISVYPNPAIDIVFINYPETKKAKMQVYDLIGKCVLESYLTKGTNDIDVSKLSEGIYVIHVTGDNWTLQSKLIKE